MENIFFSYRTLDVRLVRTVAERLKAESIPVWIDEYDIGDIGYKELKGIKEEIGQVIDTSKWGVFFFTQQYFESDNCIEELNRFSNSNPPKKLLFFKLDDCLHLRNNKNSTFSDLVSLAIPTSRSPDVILKKMYEYGVVSSHYSVQKREKEVVKDKRKSIWRVVEAGFQFSSPGWIVYSGSRFNVLDAKETLSFANLPRREFHVFGRKFSKGEIQLLLDYEIHNSKAATHLLKKVQIPPFNLANEDFDSLDRVMLKEEIRLFPKEASNAYQRYLKYLDLKNGQTNKVERSKNDIKEIGVHLFTTSYRAQYFRHRLFSFQALSSGHFFKVYKLVLPHPQFNAPISIRFIFRFSNNENFFYRYIPYCDDIVNSFSWISDSFSGDFSLTDDLLESAKTLYKKK